MKVQASYPKKRPTKLQRVYWLWAGIIVLASLLELFKYEHLPGLLEHVLPAGWKPELVAAISVCVQLFALPYLLGMKVSPLMQRFSAACAVACIATLGLLAAALL